MRVGLIALQHESNTFLGTATTWDDFQQGTVLRGAAIREHYAAAHHEIGGFLQGLEEEGLEAVPIFVAWAPPGGPVTGPALNKLLGAMLQELKLAGELHGVLVAPHGAAVADGCPDMDGAWLRELRSRVGPLTPIVGTLDPHANLTEEMVRSTDALIAYRTNPHLDQRERGREAARLMARILRGEARPTQAAAFPPLAINIERQHSASLPCLDCYDSLDDMLSDKNVLSNSLLLGFPYADVKEMGTSVLVVTNDNPDLATRLANQFAEYLRLHCNAFAGELLGVDDAVSQAMQLPGPVCLLDMGDNVGGGSPGDGTVLLEAICRLGAQKAFVCLYDPAAVEQAKKAGIGARLSLEMGGKTDRLHGDPIVAKVRVRGLYDGRYQESEARHGGLAAYDMGATVVVQLDSGQTVMLTSRRALPFSLRQLTSCNVDPAAFQIIVAKGVHAPVAAYSPVCPTLLRVNTPGVTTADMRTLAYRNRRKPLFPFEPV